MNTNKLRFAAIAATDMALGGLFASLVVALVIGFVR